MKNSVGFAPINLTLFVVGAVAVSLLALQMPFASRAVVVSVPAAQVSEVRLAPGTEGLLRQTAAHLSKMLEGASIGGFPGFEPPEDDEEYRRKIQERDYQARDVNDWVKEINNFLNQIAKKNPGLSLEEILQRQGLTARQVGGYMDALREAHYIANSMKGYGVSAETVEALETLMRILRISQWTF